MQLAHAGDDRLAGLVVGADLEGRVLLGQRAERLAELVLVGLGLGLDGHRDHRLGELHALEHDRVAGSQSVSPVVVFLRPTAATMSPANTASLSSRWLACICRRRPMRSFWSLVALRTWPPGVERARVDAEVRELADVRVAHDLERERGERLVVVGVALDRARSVFDVGALDRRRRRAGSGGSRRRRRAAAGRPCS